MTAPAGTEDFGQETAFTCLPVTVSPRFMFAVATTIVAIPSLGALAWTRATTW